MSLPALSWAASIVAILLAAQPAAADPVAPPVSARKIAAVCAGDAASFCPGYDPQGGAVRACLAQHHVSLKLACRRALPAPAK